MKRLFLLRHAKADVGNRDIARPLMARGRQDAFWLGQYLHDNDLIPDYGLCSSARRTRETLDQLQQGAGGGFESEFMDDLYLASAGTMAKLLSDLSSNIQAPILIAHNPGISQLFQILADHPPRDNRSLKYPTCSLAIIDFDITDWADLTRSAGKLYKFIIPSDAQQEQI